MVRKAVIERLEELCGRVEPDMMLRVTSREVVRLFREQLRLDFVPALHGLQGRLAAQG